MPRPNQLQKTFVFPLSTSDNIFEVFLEVSENSKQHNSGIYAAQHTLVRSLCALPHGSLASPTNDVHQVLLIVRSDVLDSQAYKETLERCGAKELFRSPNPQPTTISSVLNFVLAIKLAPEWVRVGAGLLPSQFFDSQIHYAGGIPSITPNFMFMSGGDCRLQLIAEFVKMYFLEVWQLYYENSPTTNIQRRRTHDGLILPDFNRWVTVLPKLSRGRCVGWREELPLDGLFKGDYSIMRAYWKDVYGYELPRESPKVYFDVFFSQVELQPFTYPSYCVLAASPDSVQYRNGDLKNIISNFMGVFQLKFGSICGTQIVIREELRDLSRVTNYGIIALNDMVDTNNNSDLFTSIYDDYQPSIATQIIREIETIPEKGNFNPINDNFIVNSKSLSMSTSFLTDNKMNTPRIKPSFKPKAVDACEPSQADLYRFLSSCKPTPNRKVKHSQATQQYEGKVRRVDLPQTLSVYNQTPLIPVPLSSQSTLHLIKQSPHRDFIRSMEHVRLMSKKKNHVYDDGEKKSSILNRFPNAASSSQWVKSTAKKICDDALEDLYGRHNKENVPVLEPLFGKICGLKRSATDKQDDFIFKKPARKI